MKVFEGLMLVVIFFLVLLFLAWLFNVPFSQNGTLANTGMIAYGEGLMVDRTSIDWGKLWPGATREETVTVNNTSEGNETLRMVTGNWQPQNASQYISLSWNYTGETLRANQAVPITLMLSVSWQIEGVDTFSFDITIIAEATV